MGLSGEEIALHKEEGGLSWSEITRKYGDPSRPFHKERERIRSKYRDYRKKRNPHPQKDFAEFKEDGNYAIAETKSSRIKTLEQLIEACEIDLNIWEIERHLINKWEVGAKAAHKNLKYVDGKATGTIQMAGLVVEPLFQVKAWLIRKHPIQINPSISPIEFNISFPRPGKPKKSGRKRAIVLFDPHIAFSRNLKTGALTPYHDRAAIDIAIQIVEAAMPDNIVLGGDWLDLAEWSMKYARTPDMRWTTQPALLEAGYINARMRNAVPDAEIIFVPGNHEGRIMKLLAEYNMSVAYEIKSIDEMELPPALSISRLLAFHTMNIECVEDYPNGRAYIGNQVMVEHGEISRNKSGLTVSALVEEAEIHLLVGHIHRRESATKTLRDGREVSVTCPGCLCRTDGVVPASKSNMNWQQGFAVVDYGDSIYPNIATVPILNGRAYFEGKIYEARDYVSDLRNATKDNGEEWPF